MARLPDLVAASASAARSNDSARHAFVIGPAAPAEHIEGVRIPIGAALFGGEIRYQSATGKLPDDQQFAASTPSSHAKIDLSGFNYLLNFTVRF